MCREAGARVTTNTLVRDLNVAVSRFDDRRIEVIANGLTAAGEARSRRDPARPVAWRPGAARKQPTPSFLPAPAAAWL